MKAKILSYLWCCLLFLVPLQTFSYADKIKIVTSTADLESLAKEIGGDYVTTTSIAKPTEDPHFVDAKPSFVVKLNKADLFIESGMELEIGWLRNLVIGARNKNILPGQSGYILAAKGINPLEIPDPSISDRSMGDVHSMGNPHFTLDPLNGMTIARQISERFCNIDPANCSYYEGNYNAFIEKLKIKLAEWEKKLAPFRGTKVVTYHKTYSYFAKRFNLDVVGTLEPKPGIPPSPTHINELIPMMKREGVKLIIVEPFRERRTSEFVADKTGATIIALPIMPGGQKEAEDYLSLFDYNLDIIVSSLKKE